MRSQSLRALYLALILGLLSTSTFVFAQRPNPISCSLSANGNHSLSGSFFDPYNSDRLVRQGLGLGTGCYYTPNWFRLGMGWEFYKGTFRIDHEEPGLNGSFSFDEVGVKQWVNIALVLDQAEISLTAGLEKTATSRLKADDLYIDAGGGWLNLELFAERQMLSKVDLKIWEVELNTAFKLRRNFSLTFGLLWQKYDVDMRIDFKRYGRKVLEVLDFDVDQKKDIPISQDLFYLKPGVKWCKGKAFCASAAISWGVFNSDVWSLGGTLGVEWKY